MFPGKFDYHAPTSLPDALRLLAGLGPDAKLLAGGHSLLPAMKLRLAEPTALIDLGRIGQLRGIREEAGHLVIGATTPHAAVAASGLVRRTLPALGTAAALIGDVQVRNRGTIGGSVAHDDPAADYPVALTALAARFVVASEGGSRSIPVEDFFVDYFTTALAPNEIVTEVRVPQVAGARTGYAKLEHPASGFAVVSVGVRLTLDAGGVCTEARIAVGGLGGRPFRPAAAEAALRGRTPEPQALAAAAARAADGSEPDGDAYAGREYRRHLATVYTLRALEAAL
jgi:carbon-monoxide dehydrogenase medium subunit